MGLWSWVKEKSSTVVSGLSTAYTAVTSTIGSMWSWSFSENYAKGTASQLWEGLTRVLDPNNVTRLIHSPRTRRTLTESFKANVVYYLSLAMLLETTKEAILSRVLSGEDTWMDYSVQLTMNGFVMVSLGTLMVHRYYDNTMLNLALTKQVGEENPLSNHFESCGCDSGAIIKAGVYSPLHLSTKLTSIWIASYLPVLKYAAPLGYTYAYGESLAEYPYSAAGMCTEHRAQRLARFNAYSLGLGVSMYALGELMSLLVYRYTGVNSVFVSNAIYAAIYPYFVTAVLLRDRPLIATSGVDISYYHRYVTDHMVTNIGAQIIPMLQQPGESIDLRKLAAWAFENPPARAAHWVISRDLYDDWYTFKGFVLNKPNKIFLDEYYQLIRREIDKIIELRNKPLSERKLSELPTAALAPLIPKLPSRLTKLFMTKAYKNLIRIIFEDWLEDPLMVTREMLEEIRILQETANFKTVKFNEASWQGGVRQTDAARPRVEEVDEVGASASVPLPPLSQSENSQVARVGLFAEPVIQQEQRLLARNVEQGVIAKKRAFLIELKREVNRSVWDNKGQGMFGAIVPDKVAEMRVILQPVQAALSSVDVNRTFERIRVLFALYHPSKNRHPNVERLYATIVDRVGALLEAGPAVQPSSLYSSQ